MDMSQLPAGLTPQPNQPNQDPDESAKRAQQEEQRRTLLSTVLETGARDRLTRISLVSPERSQQIEAILLRMVQSGQLRGKVSENQLIDLLDQVEDASGKASTKKSSIVFQRKKQDFDDELDF